jgi:hypothetical protein
MLSAKRSFELAAKRAFSVPYEEFDRTRPIAEICTFELRYRWRKWPVYSKAFDLILCACKAIFRNSIFRIYLSSESRAEASAFRTKAGAGPQHAARDRLASPWSGGLRGKKPY